MILASAQTQPRRGDIANNLADHCLRIDIAADHGADLIAFPEMSITGYEREDARGLAFSPQDPRLDGLARRAVDHRMVVLAGAPIRVQSDLSIGAFLFCPDGLILVYGKKYLHPGEEKFFRPSVDPLPTIQLGKERVAPAICADIDNPFHPEEAKRAGCSVYVASLFFSPQGIPFAHSLLQGYAAKHSMAVLMANFCGESWGQAAGGRSAFWDPGAVLVAELNASDPALLLVENKDESWTGRILHD